LSKIEDELPEKAEAFPALTGKFSGLRKLWVGDYRVVFSIMGENGFYFKNKTSARRLQIKYSQSFHSDGWNQRLKKMLW